MPLLLFKTVQLCLFVKLKVNCILSHTVPQINVLFIIYNHLLHLKTAVVKYFVFLSFSFLNVLLTETGLPGLA